MVIESEGIRSVFHRISEPIQAVQRRELER